MKKFTMEKLPNKCYKIVLTKWNCKKKEITCNNHPYSLKNKHCNKHTNLNKTVPKSKFLQAHQKGYPNKGLLSTTKKASTYKAFLNIKALKARKTELNPPYQETPNNVENLLKKKNLLTVT